MIPLSDENPVLRTPIVNYLLLGFTMGIAFPWVICRNIRFNTEHLTLVGELDLLDGDSISGSGGQLLV